MSPYKECDNSNYCRNYDDEENHYTWCFIGGDERNDYQIYDMECIPL